jgi:hypothetical protein
MRARPVVVAEQRLDKDAQRGSSEAVPQVRPSAAQLVGVQETGAHTTRNTTVVTALSGAPMT